MIRYLGALFTIAIYSSFVSAQDAQTAAPYDQMIGTARTLVKNQKLLEAGQLCDTAIRLDSSRWEAYALNGSILALQKRYKDAVPFLEKAIDKAPQDRKSALQQAIEEARTAARSDATPASVPAPTQAEIVLWKTVENSVAASDFEVYLKKYPDGVFALLAKSKLAELLKSETASNAVQQAREAKDRESRLIQASGLEELKAIVSSPSENFQFRSTVAALDTCTLTLDTTEKTHDYFGGAMASTVTIPLARLDTTRITPLLIHPNKKDAGVWRVSVTTINQMPAILVETHGWVNGTTDSLFHMREKEPVNEHRRTFTVNVLAFKDEKQAITAGAIISRLAKTCDESR